MSLPEPGLPEPGLPEPGLPEPELPGLVPLEGGYSGETFVSDWGGQQVVVRIHAGRSADRGLEAADIDAAVLRLVRGLLPVPEVLEVRRADPASGMPALMVTSMLPGTRLDLVLSEATTQMRQRIGASIGRILTRLASMPFLTAGSFDSSRLSPEPWSGPFTDLPSYVVDRCTSGTFDHWSEPDRNALLVLADQAQDLLDPLDRFCLVHSDFNSRNLLVNPDSGQVTGLLDWEFARAGMPVEDLGNLLRFDDEPVFTTAVLDHLDIPEVADRDLLVAQADAADLWSLIGLAERSKENPVTARGHDLLLDRARRATA